MDKILAWFSPTRWAILCVVGLALGGCIAWGVHTLKESGRDEIRAEWAAANAQAVEAQGKQNQEATTEHATNTGAAQVVYKNKIQRVVEYVASNQNAGSAGHVVCPADAQFIGLYNDTSAAR